VSTITFGGEETRPVPNTSVGRISMLQGRSRQ
jgi:hypothetical protein